MGCGVIIGVIIGVMRGVGVTVTVAVGVGVGVTLTVPVGLGVGVGVGVLTGIIGVEVGYAAIPDPREGSGRPLSSPVPKLSRRIVTLPSMPVNANSLIPLDSVGSHSKLTWASNPRYPRVSNSCIAMTNLEFGPNSATSIPSISIIPF